MVYICRYGVFTWWGRIIVAHGEYETFSNIELIVPIIMCVDRRSQCNSFHLELCGSHSRYEQEDIFIRVLL